MKKLLTCFLALSLLTGCGSRTHDEKNTAGTSTSEEQKQLTITSAVELDSERNDMSGYSWITGEKGVYNEVSLRESVRLFAENGTGVIYYGYVGCPWCERAIPELNKVMVELNLPVYYVDASHRDDEAYDALLPYVQDDLREEEGEPVFYVPYVVGVKNGKIVKSQIALVSDYSNKDTSDPTDQMNDSQKKELQDIYRSIFESVAD